MKNLTNSQRSYLKSQAHHLEPVIIIGKNGLTEGTIYAIQTALKSRELIKIKFRGHKEDKQKILEKILTETVSIIVGTIGHTIILIKQISDPEKQKYLLP